MLTHKEAFLPETPKEDGFTWSANPAVEMCLKLACVGAQKITTHTVWEIAGPWAFFGFNKEPSSAGQQAGGSKLTLLE